MDRDGVNGVYNRPYESLYSGLVCGRNGSMCWKMVQMP